MSMEGAIVNDMSVITHLTMIEMIGICTTTEDQDIKMTNGITINVRGMARNIAQHQPSLEHFFTNETHKWEVESTQGNT